jgi:hypothetical protein
MKPGPLRKLLSGEKTIESRFSRICGLPHGRVSPGDRIFFKESGGPVRCFGTALAAATWRLEGPDDLNALRLLYNRWIRAEDDYWESKRDARWATLIRFETIVPVEPTPFPKNDRRPWLTLDGDFEAAVIVPGSAPERAEIEAATERRIGLNLKGPEGI